MADYRSYVERGELDALAAEMGRDRSTLCRKAKELGLTDHKKSAQFAAAKAADLRAGVSMWGSRPHPRGMLGKAHSAETKDVLRNKSIAAQARVSGDERAARITKSLKSRIISQGSLAPNHKAGSWKAGWREIGEKRNYYRSRWEANYARYLQWLKERGEIADWQHEPETFWFENIKRGVRSYLPDFRVFEKDGTSNLHEVKGWMDSRSKTTLRRMAKYHPQETVIVVRERDYNAIARTAGRMIEGWESSNRSDRP